jgi:hypothetical protein
MVVAESEDEAWPGNMAFRVKGLGHLDRRLADTTMDFVKAGQVCREVEALVGFNIFRHLPNR